MAHENLRTTGVEGTADTKVFNSNVYCTNLRFSISFFHLKNLYVFTCYGILTTPQSLIINKA